MTEVGRQFQRPMEEGKKERQRLVDLQYGYANECGFRKHRDERSAAGWGRLAARLGGPSPWINLHNSSSLKRRRLQAKVGQPTASRTLLLDIEERRTLNTARATDSCNRSKLSASDFVHESQTGLAYSSTCLTRPTYRRFTSKAEPTLYARCRSRPTLGLTRRSKKLMWCDHPSDSVSITPRWRTTRTPGITALSSSTSDVWLATFRA